MRQKRQYTSAVLLIICLLGITACTNEDIVSQLPEKIIEETEEIKTYEEIEVNSGYSKDGKDRYIIQRANETAVSPVNGEFYVYLNGEGIRRTIQWTDEDGREVTYEVYKKVTLNFYAYGDNKLVKSIDLSEAYNDPNFPYYITDFSTKPVLYQNAWCLHMGGYRIPEEEKDLLTEEKEDFYLDIETLDIYPGEGNYWNPPDPEKVEEEKKEIGWKLNFVMQKKTEPDIWENNGLDYTGCLLDYMYDGKEVKTYGLIRFESEELPEKGAKLYDEFPDLEKYYGKEGYTVRLIMFDIPTNEEYLNYFLDEVSFEGMRLSKEYAVDGQRHEIGSIDDYYMYRYGVHEGDEMPEEFELEVY